MKRIRPLYIPPLRSEQPETGSLILRDGTTASIRPGEPTDRAMIQQFINRLSPESRRHRFFSESQPSIDLITGLCDSSKPRSQFTLIVTRIWKGALRIIATGSYWAKDEHTAEVALAVDDEFHG